MKALILGILTATAVYLLGAFVAWDLNAGNWHWDGRLMVGLCGFALSMGVVGANV